MGATKMAYHKSYKQFLSIDDVSATTGFLLVDKSDTTNWPHNTPTSGTIGHVVIDDICGHINFGAASGANGHLNIGVIKTIYDIPASHLVYIYDYGGGTDTISVISAGGNLTVSATGEEIGDATILVAPTQFNVFNVDVATGTTWGGAGGKWQYATAANTWSDLTIITDGSISATDSLEQDGTVKFVMPTDWVSVAHTANTGSTTAGYAIRFVLTATQLTQQAIAQAGTFGLIPAASSIVNWFTRYHGENGQYTNVVLCIKPILMPIDPLALNVGFGLPQESQTLGGAETYVANGTTMSSPYGDKTALAVGDVVLKTCISTGTMRFTIGIEYHIENG